MNESSTTYLDFEIDKLTNSIENAISGEVFDTIIVQLNSTDAKSIKKSDWVFDWKTELKSKEKMLYKLTTISNPKIIHGFICITDKSDHIL